MRAPPIARVLPSLFPPLPCNRQLMDIPRFLPEIGFPPYTYVPGRTPHPVSDPAGHLFGEEPERAELIVDDWPQCRAYLRGIDLFNHGFYWEAHEVWESLWHAAGRTGPVANFLKGLIKLAAAGVKSLEGSAAGRTRHAARASELFRHVAKSFEPAAHGSEATMMGLSLCQLEAFAEQAVKGDIGCRSVDSQVCPTFPFVLIPEDVESQHTESDNDDGR